MRDIFDRETRSHIMSMIKGKDTKPEIIVRKFLHHHGYRFRLHVDKLPGKPDIVLPKYKTVIFVNGCFWHGHKGCKYFVLPKTRTDWWLNKINKTKERDTITVNKLHQTNWKVYVIWECALRPKKQEETFNALIQFLQSAPLSDK